MTRYPESGKGGQWKVLELKAIPLEWKGDTLSDGGGLSGDVRISRDGSINVKFKYAFKWEGKVRWHQCGTYPNKSLADIRQERNKARQMLGDGINPTDDKKATKIEAQAAITATIAKAEQEKTEALSINDLFESWIETGVSRKDGNAELQRSFERDILPAIGHIKISDLTETDLLVMLKKIKKRATSNDPQRALNRTIEAVYLNTRQMLKWAEKRQPWRRLMIEGNPIDLVELKHVQDMQDEGYSEVRDRVLSCEEIRELHSIFSKLETDYEELPVGQKYSGIRPVNKRVQSAAWICLSTLCRIGELLMARWEEVDLSAGTWFIPAVNTKGRKGKRQDHRIALSSFAIRQFQNLRAETGHTDFCFPSKNETSHVCVKTVSKLIGDRQARFKNRSKPLSGRQHNDTLVLSNGERGEWTPHDLRRTGATMMQSLGVTLDIIDRCQNHVLDGSKTRKHYMHYDYAKEKAEAWHKWGERLEIIIYARNVVQLSKDA